MLKLLKIVWRSTYRFSCQGTRVVGISISKSVSPSFPIRIRWLGPSIKPNPSPDVYFACQIKLCLLPHPPPARSGRLFASWLTSFASVFPLHAHCSPSLCSLRGKRETYSYEPSDVCMECQYPGCWRVAFVRFFIVRFQRMRLFLW